MGLYFHWQGSLFTSVYYQEYHELFLRQFSMGRMWKSREKGICPARTQYLSQVFIIYVYPLLNTHKSAFKKSLFFVLLGHVFIIYVYLLRKYIRKCLQKSKFFILIGEESSTACNLLHSSG
jgi:hypothetical protein